jgi:hypothetical protein
MYLEKITAVQDWEAPCNLKDSWVFLGFANFYHLFVQNYSKVIQLLTPLIWKGIAFV